VFKGKHPHALTHASTTREYNVTLNLYRISRAQTVFESDHVTVFNLYGWKNLQLYSSPILLTSIITFACNHLWYSCKIYLKLQAIQLVVPCCVILLKEIIQLYISGERCVSTSLPSKDMLNSIFKNVFLYL